MYRYLHQSSFDFILYRNPFEEIDVVSVDPETPSPFDSHKSKVLANELERSLRCNPNIDVNRPKMSIDP